MKTFIRTTLSLDTPTKERIDELVIFLKFSRSQIVKKAIAELWVRLLHPEDKDKYEI